MYSLEGKCEEAVKRVEEEILENVLEEEEVVKEVVKEVEIRKGI